jgi:hypothetical protein
MDQLTLPAPAAPPTPVEWRIAPLATGAHAFWVQPGFPRTVCRQERWNVHWQPAADTDPRCPDCTAAVELELRAQWGDG